MKKNGFTLVELLAIIIMIGLVGVILVPSAISIIDKTGNKAFESSVAGYIKAVKTDHISRGGLTNSYIIKDGKLTHDATSEAVEVENKSKENGNLSINDANEIDGSICNENKCIVYYKNQKYEKNEVADYKVYKEELLNGTIPETSSNLIPVTIANDGTVKTADITKKWYSYEDKLWANAVTVKKDKIKNYEEKLNTKVEEEDILAYFVWIPRYKYKIPTGGTSTPSSIDIVFEDKFTTKSTGNATTEYFTHPGFTFGEDELNGIWVGKFETTGTEEEPTILPNITSLRNQTISEQFYTALKFNDYVVTKDTHMMKNTEWGTAAYLSHSKYGIDEEVRINNSFFVTGCGASSPNDSESTDCQIEYGNNIDDLPQSTTGNITGIFDMSGGAWERVMGNLNNILASSGFNEMPPKKYYDFYDSNSYSTGCNGGLCLGHATIETRSWHSDYYSELTYTEPWVSHSGGYGIRLNTGVFYTNFSAGDSLGGSSFRVVIANEN